MHASTDNDAKVTVFKDQAVPTRPFVQRLHLQESDEEMMMVWTSEPAESILKKGRSICMRGRAGSLPMCVCVCVGKDSVDIGSRRRPVIRLAIVGMRWCCHAHRRVPFVHPVFVGGTETAIPSRLVSHGWS